MRKAVIVVLCWFLTWPPLLTTGQVTNVARLKEIAKQWDTVQLSKLKYEGSEQWSKPKGETTSGRADL